MEQTTFHKDAHEVQPLTVDITVNVAVRDEQGNLLQVVPVTCAGVCYPYGANLENLLLGVVRQMNGKIHANRPQNTAPPSCVPGKDPLGFG